MQTSGDQRRENAQVRSAVIVSHRGAHSRDRWLAMMGRDLASLLPDRGAALSKGEASHQRSEQNCSRNRRERIGWRIFCDAAKPSAWPLLTGNGNWASFSVLVPLVAYKLLSPLFALCKKHPGGYMRKLILAAASIAALTLAGPASAQAPIVIKFSHVVATNTPKGLAAEKFKELAEKYTAGKVKVEVYPNSQLYKDKEELEALQLGAVQMLAPSNAKFGPIGVKEFEVFDLPYILPDLKTLRKVTDGPLGAKLLKLLDAKGMTGLAYWDNGFKMMSANKKLMSPADYKGLKFRIQSSKVLEAQFRTLGAIPQVMAFSEVYQALQTGVVDGQENTWSNIYTQKMHEVQKYITETNHGYIGYIVVVNKKFWDGIPADVRTELDKAMKEATAYGNGQSQKENDDALAEIKKAGKSEIVKLTPEQDAAMRKALEPVYKDVASRVGQPTIDEFLKETRGATN
jgi:C4-dicarboxylate-binding protein DctP